MKETDKTELKNFFKKLSDMNCISLLWEKVLDVLVQLQPDISFETLAVFCIYFSQLDDGNICIPLDGATLIAKWQKKWKGLLLQENIHNKEDEDYEYFSKIIKKGISEISKNNLPNLISNFDSSNPNFSKPFVIDESWLFGAKYFKAKISIEKRIKSIMKHNTISPLKEEQESVREYFKNLTFSETNNPIILKDEQTQAILRGLNENLIITGGPGTGKTTVVCYLLWDLLLTKDMMDYSLYLAAPSGKAADRMKESIQGTLERLLLDNLPSEQQPDAKAVFEKLNSVQSSTIHRLLSFNPSTNGFRYNAENQFDEKSIFVIDEASMIDISLFSSLLEAIPEGARVFILGDKDQLPSVQAGAVLGELLAKKKDSVAELKESSRFNDDSPIGRLKNAMQEDAQLEKELANITQWNTWNAENKFELPPAKQFPVTTFAPCSKYEDKIQEIDQMIEQWTQTFYASLTSDVQNIWIDSSEEQLNQIWEKTIRARILCAERRGLLGVEDINKKICEQIVSQSPSNISLSDDYFAGQLLMLTKNQSIFCLYNGDSGIVIEHNDLKYLMVKKDLKTDFSNQTENNTITTNERSLERLSIIQKGSYIFYPLHLLPKESIETAYAITIHKSQGSGYKAILVFVPQQKGHPLLNRQIVYTAITRTEGSTYIYANFEMLKSARKTVITRDTRINL